MRVWPLIAAGILVWGAPALGDDALGGTGVPPTPGLDIAAASGRSEPTAPADRPGPPPDAFRGLVAPHSRVGLAVEGGFPNLANCSLLVRPVRTIRLFAGPSWGYVAWGANGGVLFEPFPSWISPTLSFTLGELFQADLSALAKGGGVPAGFRPFLQKVDYQYATADLGLEVGSSDGLAFFLRLGLSYVQMKASGSSEYTTGSGSTVSMTSPSLHGTFPSAKAGLQYFF